MINTSENEKKKLAPLEKAKQCPPAEPVRSRAMVYGRDDKEMYYGAKTQPPAEPMRKVKPNEPKKEG